MQAGQDTTGTPATAPPAHRAAEDLLVDLARQESPSPLHDLLATALRDPSLRVGFWVSPSAGYVDAAGRTVVLDDLEDGKSVTRITSNGEPLAVFVADTSVAREPELVDAVLGAARAALENERLQAELRAQLAEVRASRERIVTAGDEERRRIERNLHDGAQQRLVSLAMSLRLLRVQLGDDVPGEIATTIEAIQGELRDAINELRELGRGIHPALLTDEGLIAALRALADRSPLPVVLDGNLDPRPSPAVEAAAYFVGCESLTNAVRHANASEVRITVWSDDHVTSIRVQDDGLGGANPRGSGLRGLADRVAALGGDLHVTSGRGEGTCIEATFPEGIAS
jgi:signal transduction histidine kinase